MSRIDAEALADCSIVLVRLQRSYLRSPSFVLVLGTTNVGTLAERSRLPLLTSLANLHLSCKYVGANPREIWYISTASLKSIRWLTGNQIELSQDWCSVFSSANSRGLQT